MFTVKFRPVTGGRWKIVATTMTFAEAVLLVSGSGDWWIHEVSSLHT